MSLGVSRNCADWIRSNDALEGGALLARKSEANCKQDGVADIENTGEQDATKRRDCTDCYSSQNEGQERARQNGGARE